MLVLGTSNQLTNIQEGFKSLNGYPFVANSGVYKCEIVRATLEDVFTSDKEREVNGGQERKKAIHLGLLATSEDRPDETGQMWIDVDLSPINGKHNHLSDLCIITGNCKPYVDQNGQQAINPETGKPILQCFLEDKVEQLSKPLNDGRTSIIRIPGLEEKSLLVCVSRFGQSKIGQPRVYVRGFFTSEGLSAVELDRGLPSADLNKARSQNRPEGHPMWHAPQRQQQQRQGQAYGAQTGAAYGQATNTYGKANNTYGHANNAYGQASQAYSGGLQRPQPSPQAQAAYGQAIQNQTVAGSDEVPF